MAGMDCGAEGEARSLPRQPSLHAPSVHSLC